VPVFVEMRIRNNVVVLHACVVSALWRGGRKSIANARNAIFLHACKHTSTDEAERRRKPPKQICEILKSTQLSRQHR
jgi:hypothetical protein